jgi:hypothetical protein
VMAREMRYAALGRIDQELQVDDKIRMYEEMNRRLDILPIDKPSSRLTSSKPSKSSLASSSATSSSFSLMFPIAMSPSIGVLSPPRGSNMLSEAWNGEKTAERLSEIAGSRIVGGKIAETNHIESFESRKLRELTHESLLLLPIWPSMHLPTTPSEPFRYPGRCSKR